MKFTLSWLKEHLVTGAAIDEIARVLNRIGLEVEDIDNAAERLGAFVIARVIDAKPHPQADRLRVCQVDTGSGVLEVVCGAPNARAGLIGVFAPLGTFIPGTGITLEKKPVRGIISHGMLCSERELELSQDHDGIIDLASDLESAVGQRYVDVMGLDDPVIHIKITANRPDALGVRGIARDLAAAGLGSLAPADEGFIEKGAFPHPVPITLDFEAGSADACPVFASRFLRNVRNGPSPAWLRRRLKAIGLRPINALVDVTNYITFDRGRPLHVYDADKLNGAIHARLARSGERFLALDNKEYAPTSQMCVIADDQHVLGLGGIMGGAGTGCSEATVNVLIESAYFDPVRTGATGRQSGILSDARYRFERGIDPQSAIAGANLAAKMIHALCGGDVSTVRVAGEMPDPRTTITFDTNRIERLTGLAVENTRAREILLDLGFTLSGKGDRFQVVAPSWRPDVHGPADLVEEIVRIVGIDHVPSVPLPRVAGVARPVLTELQKRVRRARRSLAARGMVEAITYSFITKTQASLFGGGDAALQLANPISSEMSDMRPSVLPGLLAAVLTNINRGHGDLALFEVGQAYAGTAPGDQRMLAGGIRTGLAGVAGMGRHWANAQIGGQSGTQFINASGASVFDAKADAFALLAAAGLDPAKAQITRDAPAWFHPGRSGTLRLGPKVALGYFGEVHPDVLEAMGIDARVVVFEIVLDAIPLPKRKGRARTPLDLLDLQPVRRDFAFVVDANVQAATLVKAAEGVDKTLVTAVTVFDVFEGGKLAEEGRKSVALEVTLQPRTKTLTDIEIEAVSVRIVAAVKAATGGEIRA